MPAGTGPGALTLALYTVLRMVAIVLNRRLNYRNILLTARPGGDAGCLLPDGERRFVRWLGFIERAAARDLQDAQPVRLADITRIGMPGWPAPTWHDVPVGMHVHGCLTDEGVFAVYDTAVALVGARGES